MLTTLNSPLSHVPPRTVYLDWTFLLCSLVVNPGVDEEDGEGSRTIREEGR